MILKKKCNFRVVYNYPFKLDGIVKKAKDKIHKLDNKIVVYKVSCNDCDKCYVCQTSRPLEIREYNIKYKDQYHNVISKDI